MTDTVGTSFHRLYGSHHPKHPTAIHELLAYQFTIIKASQQYDGLQWRAYDTHFRISAAATGNKRWSCLDTDLYTRFFTGRAKPKETCSHCDVTTHSSADCSKRGRKRELGKYSAVSPLLKKRKQWPSDVCAEFNTKGACSFGAHCKYRHPCSQCAGEHPTRSSTAKLKGSDS